MFVSALVLITGDSLRSTQRHVIRDKPRGSFSTLRKRRLEQIQEPRERGTSPGLVDVTCRENSAQQGDDPPGSKSWILSALVEQDARDDLEQTADQHDGQVPW